MSKARSRACLAKPRPDVATFTAERTSENGLGTVRGGCGRLGRLLRREGIERRHRPAIGVGGQRIGDHLESGDTVDHGVVHLDIQRESTVLETVDQIRNPHRSRPVEPFAVQLADQLPQRFAIGARRQRAALDVVTHVDVVVAAPHPDACGVDADVRVPTKSRIKLSGARQRIAVQLVDIPRARLAGGDRISSAATCIGSDSSSAVIIATSNGSSRSIGSDPDTSPT